MGLGTNSSFAPFQIAGYIIEQASPYIELTQKNSPRGAMPKTQGDGSFVFTDTEKNDIFKQGDTYAKKSTHKK